jgi:phosphatidylserine decarboxylase
LGVKHIPGLFARNERILTYLQTGFGECAIIKVGATVVGKIRVCYHEQVSNLPGAQSLLSVLDTPKPLKRGDEIGVFELGSTVICLFQPGQMELDSLKLGQAVCYGQSLGNFLEK